MAYAIVVMESWRIMNPINTHNDPFIKELMKLSKKKYRDESDILLVEGAHLVQEAKDANLLKKTIGLQGTDIIISPSVAAKLSQTKSGSSVFGVVNKPIYHIGAGSRFMVLDCVQDPGNVGTLIRSAYSFGFDAVVVSDDSADIYSDKVIRASQGSIFHMPVVQGDVVEWIDRLRAMGNVIVSTHVDTKNATLSNINRDRKLAIVMGSEGRGVSEAVLSMSDETLHIETSNFESLNVGVAGSIIAYSLRKGTSR